MKIGAQKEITMQNGKTGYLTIYHNDSEYLVVACEYNAGFMRVSSKNIDSSLNRWYDQFFPDELKNIFKREDLTIPCAENFKPFNDIHYNVQHEEDRDALLEIVKKYPAHFAFMENMWLRNEPTGAHDVKPIYSPRTTQIYPVSVMNPNSSFMVLPVFWIKK